MTPVNKESFYKVIYEKDLDVCVYSRCRGTPTTLIITDFKFRSGMLFGISETNYNLDSENYGEVTYYLGDDWVKFT